MTANRRIVRKTRLADQGKEDDLRNTTAAERLGMVWDLTVQAWAFMGEDIAERRLQRHIVRVVRRNDKDEKARGPDF